MIDFRDCRLADAEITSVATSGYDLRVDYLDWQEQARALIFRGVVGYQAYRPEGRQLSHGEVEDDPDFVTLACRLAEEDVSPGLTVFAFVSTWDGAKILRLVAREVAAV